MKSRCFHYSLLTISIAAFMSLNTANAATATAVSAPAAAINNKASASYSIGTVAQPVVESNTVTVNVTETANFSLIATLAGGNADANINQVATPGSTNTFTHTLSNTGNVRDTYTIRTTGDNDPDIITTNKDYPLGVASINFVIKQTGGTVLTDAQKTALSDFGQATTTGTVVNGGSIKLIPGTIAELSYAALTPSTQTGNQKGVGTLTATSAFFTTVNSTKPTLVNENQSIVKLPVFKIEKTATCQSSTNCSSLDLNAANTDITYSIKVTNATTDYSVAADNFIIRDVLPAGMTLSGNVAVSTTGATITSTGKDSSNRQIIDITVPSLAVGSNTIISFKVSVNKTTLSAAGSATNHATVYDRFSNTVPVPGTDTSGYDIVDSTDTVAANNVTKVPDEGAGTAGADTATTITFTDRKLTITTGTTKEISILGGEVKYTHTLTNTGNASEGGVNRPIGITITDPDTAKPLEVKNPKYKLPNGNEIALEVIDAATGKYKLPIGVTLAPNATVEISYTVVSDGTNADLGKSETNSLQVVLPQGATADSTFPTVSAVSNTTTIKGLTLLKQLALQVGCTGAITAYEGTLGSNSTATFKSNPGDCVYYKITATNTFTTLGLNNVVVSDSTSQWKDANGRVQAVYQNNAVGSDGSSNTGLTGTGDAQKVSTTFATLASGASGTLIFSTKVSS